MDGSPKQRRVKGKEEEEEEGMTHGGGAALDMRRLHNNTQWHQPNERTTPSFPSTSTIQAKRKGGGGGERKHEIEMGKGRRDIERGDMEGG